MSEWFQLVHNLKHFHREPGFTHYWAPLFVSSITIWSCTIHHASPRFWLYCLPISLADVLHFYTHFSATIYCLTPPVTNASRNISCPTLFEFYNFRLHEITKRKIQLPLCTHFTCFFELCSERIHVRLREAPRTTNLVYTKTVELP